MLNKYNRRSAVNYAVKYAVDPNENYKYFKFINGNGGDCTNFVSQCLKAGGAPMDKNNIRPWWYQSGKASICWGVAHSLYWYLKMNQSTKRNAIKGQEVQDVNELEIGDVIFYENYRNIIFHAAIITSLIDIEGNKEPRISQHSNNQLNETYKKNYDYKKEHFLKIIL
ncbi:amidase domain-containing protein [Clostridium lacusfryxellense]|uniref:amidase domain-containing protein n=1 Tax=Clostridium lacusfryxellense TaxID=205328 RepID=UPI001C0C49A7|nr:amidase domain-containing protein [Clostridium lacusfryxellense]MBU3114352.1 amidase domain-containing protein [Clostridium lacusfryxellense]